MIPEEDELEEARRNVGEPDDDDEEPPSDDFPEAGSYVSPETLRREAWDAKFGPGGTHKR